MSTHFHKFSTVLSLLAVGLFVFTAVVQAQPLMSPRFEQMTCGSSIPDSLVSVVIFMDNHSAQNKVFRINEQSNLNRSARIKAVTRSLKSFQASGSGTVEFFLKNNSVTDIEKFWIVPAFAATIPADRLDELSRFTGISMIIPDVALEYIEPVEIKNAPAIAASSTTALQMLNVPALWSQGYTGQGRLVCSFDTGVESTHPALSSKWRGNHAPLSECWYSPINPSVAPYDNVGHGTHTMGIVLGSVAADTFGVAPGAEWITAGVIDQGRDLNTMLSDIIRAFQWALNPDGDTATTDDVPDVISNSWGVPAGILPPCNDLFWQVIDNAEAAGIVTIFAAGNEGPDPASIRNPADRASTPINSFSVGAVDNDKVIAGFSSRGPSSCDANKIKPEIVAPGVGIYSSTKGGTYKVMSGTSMAAPFISGLVLLCRQYNPDATVEQIKCALLQAAEDLGPVGEDNAYGHGLVDASKLFSFLPLPSTTNFIITGTGISGDGVAAPGETVELQLTLQNSAGNVDQVTGRLFVEDETQVNIIDDEATFFFGIGGTMAMNFSLFNMTFNEELRHGDEVLFNLIVEKPEIFVCDTLEFTLPIGFVPPGNVVDIQNSRIAFSASDFAQYGFAPGSIYNLTGQGFRYNNSENLLYEAGIILGRNNLQLSSSVRNEVGVFVPSDFTPVEEITSDFIAGDGATRLKARYNDTYSEISIPVTVAQEIISYDDGFSDGFVIMKYRLVNESLENLTHLSFGFMADFDLSGQTEQVVLNETMEIIYQKSPEGPMVGLVNLKNIASYKAFENGSEKVGFTRGELFNIIASTNNNIDSTPAGDMLFMVCSEALDIKYNDSVEIAFALVAGDNVDELISAALIARQKYDVITAIEIEEGNRPTDYTLNQNYPNPFNPTTTISFSLPVSGEVGLEVFNLLGQKVKVLQNGQMSAGQHTLEWDATGDDGHSVATGVYFYRLTTSEFTQTKKMMLLK
ncbi:MAG: S8 family peptidase [candidate division Zixibacteria bacterium]|nr:S8 family peptidase [candidate division Zixibacteria bacterium]